MKYKQWQVAAPCPEGQRALERAGLSPLLAGLLAARGITRPEEARRLLSPKSEPIPDPMLLRDMDKAVARVRRALELAGGHILDTTASPFPPDVFRNINTPEDLDRAAGN